MLICDTAWDNILWVNAKRVGTNKIQVVLRVPLWNSLNGLLELWLALLSQKVTVSNATLVFLYTVQHVIICHLPTFKDMQVGVTCLIMYKDGCFPLFDFPVIVLVTCLVCYLPLKADRKPHRRHHHRLLASGLPCVLLQSFHVLNSVSMFAFLSFFTFLLVQRLVMHANQSHVWRNI